MKRALCNLPKESLDCHSERSEESAFVLRGIRTLFLVVASVSAGVAPAAHAQVPSGRDVVKPEVYASLDPAARGSSFQIAVVMKIRPGFHVNAREKSEEYLIATDLKAQLPAGFSSGDVVYPKGKLETFTFSKKPLNVYQDTVVLRMPVTALPAAPLGEQHIPVKLRYQACNQELCLPPATLSLDAVVNIASSASAAKPAHPELFSRN